MVIGNGQRMNFGLSFRFEAKLSRLSIIPERMVDTGNLVRKPLALFACTM